MNSVSNGSQPSRQPRKYGRSATTSVAQLFTENDVVRSCTNLLQRLTTKNLPNPRASEFNGNCDSSPTTPYISAAPTTTSNMLKSSQNMGPDSPALERRGQRKNSGASIVSNQSDSYAFVKYKPPLPTSSSSSAYGSNGALQNGYRNGETGSRSGLGKSSVSNNNNNFSYFGNDRLKELEQKLSDRYQRIFGSGTGGSSSSVTGLGTSNKNLAEDSSSDLRSSIRNRKYEDNNNDDFRGYGLTKSASTSSGAASSVLGSSRLPFSSSTLSSTYGYENGGGRLPLSSSNLASSSSAITGSSNRGGGADLYSSRRSYGLAKSASSSVIQDSGLGLSTGSSSGGGKYYSLFGAFNSPSARPYGGSNSHLLEPVPETHKTTKVDSHTDRDRDRGLRESSGLSRSNTLNNLDRVLDEDSVEGGAARGTTLVRTDSNTKFNGDEELNGGSRSSASQRKSSYKLPSRYYYRRYRHKSSHAPPKEASPLRLTNDSNQTTDGPAIPHDNEIDDDDRNNNAGSSSSSKKTSLVNNTDNDYALALALSHQLNGVLPSMPSSHVLAYDVTPRNKISKDVEEFLNGVAGSSASGIGSGNKDRYSDHVDDHFGRDTSDASDVDVVRKKEIEDLIKKYSGFTYTSSKYVQLKTPATGNGVDSAAGGTSSVAGASSDLQHHRQQQHQGTYKDDFGANNQISNMTGYGGARKLQATGPSGIGSALAQSSSSNHIHSSSKYEYGKSSRATLGYGALEDSRSYAKSYRTGKEVSNAVIYNDIVSSVQSSFRVCGVYSVMHEQCLLKINFVCRCMVVLV
jgi:hypothetical protein